MELTLRVTQAKHREVGNSSTEKYLGVLIDKWNTIKSQQQRCPGLYQQKQRPWSQGSDYLPLLVRLHLEYGIWFSASNIRKTLMTGLSSVMSDQDDQEAGTFAL